MMNMLIPGSILIDAERITEEENNWSWYGGQDKEMKKGTGDE